MDLPPLTPEEQTRIHIHTLEYHLKSLRTLKSQGPRAWREAGFTEAKINQQITNAETALTKLKGIL